VRSAIVQPRPGTQLISQPITRTRTASFTDAGIAAVPSGVILNPGVHPRNT
jgi:hypothetical protein